MKINPAIQDLSREQLVKLLEEGQHIQCYDHESTQMLMEALQECVNCGDVTISDLTNLS